MTASPQADVDLADQTVPRMLARQSARYGTRQFLTLGATRRTYAEQHDAVAVAAGTLGRAGIAAGDRVALICSNRVEALDLTLGCMWLGAIAVPINRASRGAQLQHMLTNSGARILVIDAELLGVLDALEHPPDTVERLWALDDTPLESAGGYRVEPAPPPGEPMAPAEVGPGDTAAILYTSGTTGVSKGVCCPHAQLHWYAVNAAQLLEVREGDVLYTCLPLFHINALSAVLQAVVCGGSIVIDERFSASRFFERLADVNADVTYLLGAMVTILGNREQSRADVAHRTRVALAPATRPDLHATFRERFGIQIVEGYASTETNVAIGGPVADQRPGYMGRVADGFEAKVVDESDLEVAEGAAGELVLRHREPFAFATGYHDMPEKTVEAWRNLWFHTGDRVVREEGGWFRFLDRLKDAIRRRGENVSSFEVEQALIAHPAVAQVAVFPVPAELGEDDVMAAVVTAAGAHVDPVELIRHCEPRLAYFAIPRYLEIVDELPLTENGKVRKFVLRERGVSEATWDREAAGIEITRDAR